MNPASCEGLTAEAVIEQLDLQPHPEGGWFRETYRTAAPEGERAASTAIYFLLKKGERSHWHRVLDADEFWHWHAGGTVRLRQSDGKRVICESLMGPDVLNEQTPQLLIPQGVWQTAEPVGDWVLVGCTVAPAFEFSGFELAPKGWEPGQPLG